MAIKFEMFSDARIALQREVKEHPLLIELLKIYEQDDWPGQLGEIAAYVLVMMDGMYMPHELEKLYDILFWKLRGKRGGIVVIPDGLQTLH